MAEEPREDDELMHILKDTTHHNFELLQTIGEGTFGRVKLCNLRETGYVFAMKILKKSEVIRLKQEEHIASERKLLMLIDHPFVVKLHRTFQTHDDVYMLLEYICGGELFHHLRKAGRFSKEFSKFYVGQIVLVLHYLHGKNIVYRDLKPENLLIGNSGYLKITDFGFAKIVEENTWTLCGTPEYLAPEIIQSKGHGPGVDWWALGILMFEMLCGYPPFYDENPFGIYQKILVGKIDYPKHVDEFAKDIIKRLLHADKTLRLGCLSKGADDIKRHKFFRGVDWNALHSRRIQAPIVPQVDSLRDTHNFESYPDKPEVPSSPLSAAQQTIFEDF